MTDSTLCSDCQRAGHKWCNCSRPAPQQACPECKGAGGWANTARGSGVGGQTMTMCESCDGTGAAPQQEQAAPDTSELYYAHMEADRKDAEDAYFAVRPKFDYPMQRAAFCAGYERAYQKLWNARAQLVALQVIADRQRADERYYSDYTDSMRVSDLSELHRAIAAALNASPPKEAK